MSGAASRRRRVTVVVACVAVAASACGDGPSKDEFLKEANAVCAKHRATIEAAASKVLGGGKLPSPQQFGKLAKETILPQLTAQFRELRPIEAPDDLADAFTNFVSRGDKAVAAIRKDPSTLTNPDNFAAANRQSDKTGLSDACHIGP